MTFAMSVLYHQPADPAAFDEHYASVHQGLAAKIPGLRSYTTTHPAPGPDGTPAEFYLLATLTFADADAYGTGMSGPEGKAALDDLGNFAQAGTTVLTGDLHTVV